MSFSRVKPIGWAFGEILTNEQMDQLDVNVSRAIDGTDGGNYLLESPLELQGERVHLDRLAISIRVGPNSNTTIHPSTGQFIYVPTLSDSRIYTISDPGTANDDFMYVTNNVTDQSVFIRNPSAVDLAELRNASGYARSVIVAKVSGSWVVFAANPFVTLLG